MATSQSPISRQPDQLDYASPTQFRFGIHQLPKVEFFTVNANLPGINISPASMPTPYKDIPIIGEKTEYDNLTITFIVDEYLENYISLHNWMTGIGFPQDRSQFSTFRDTTSNTPAAGGTNPVDRIGKTVPDKAMYSDAFLMILSNKNNPVVEVNFSNIFPISLSALDFSQAATDVEYMTASADFSYQLYEINTL
jgi:hypothetical protein|tara:strand:- start:1984 stop:2568 length:585 start_codon:yes stop_codon:yes gene_type:complete